MNGLIVSSIEENEIIKSLKMVDFNKKIEDRKSFAVRIQKIGHKNINSENVSTFKSMEKPVYVISPELIPENVFNNGIENRWTDFLKLKVDGICSDLPNEFLRYFKKSFISEKN